MMSLVLAAGNGERFAGYSCLKPLLPMPDGRPLIAWVRDRLPAGEQVIVIRAADRPAFGAWTDGMGVVALTRETDGPLASAYAARTRLHGELLIVYCDVLFDCVVFAAVARSSGAPHACVVFPSCDPRYGYWDGERVVEKQVVSSQAVSGVFYFRDAAVFVQRIGRMSKGAGIPDLLDAETFCYGVGAVIDVGTPADYEAFVSMCED